MLASTTRKQYLEEMGIDVWVLREGRTRAPETREEASESGTEDARAAAPPEPAAAAPPPEFHLCFATYGSFSLIFSVTASATSLPDEMRRFIDDIALALSIDAKPTISALKWPMVKAANIDQSEPAARTAIEQRIDDCGETRLVFGETALQWVAGTAGEPLPDIETCMQSAGSKRALWETLKRISA